MDEDKKKGEYKIVEMGGSGGTGGANENASKPAGDANRNADKTAGSTSGSSPVTRGEGREGVSNVKMDSDGTQDEKAYGEAGNGLRTQSAKNHENLNGWDKNYQPKKKIPLWAVLVGIVVLIGVVAGVIALMSSREGQGEAEKRPETGQEQPDEGDKDDDNKDNETEKPEDTEKNETLSLDNQVVQRLWHNFDGVTHGRVGGAGPVREARFYVDKDAWAGRPSKGLMAGVAAQAIPLTGICRGWQEDPAYYFDGDIYSYDKRLSSSGCYDGENVKRKIKEIFGKDVDFRDGDIVTSKYCGHYEYSAKNDEFYSPDWGCGGAGGEAIGRWLYKAERSGLDIYLYEKVVVDTPGALYGVLLPNQDGEIADKNRVIYSWDCTPSQCGENYDISEHLDELDEYKWTFTRNEDGEYVFAGLEKAEK